jgi:hypothetical protein
MLLLKLILTPLFIGTISLVGRRWGATVSGWLIGLPLTSAPIALFLSFEQGTNFASHVASGILVGCTSQAAFCLTYGWLSFRIGWPGCWLIGWSVFFAATFAFEQVSIPLPLVPFVFAGVIGVLIVVLLLFPKQREPVDAAKPPAWDIAARMIVATAMVLGLTSAAGLLGPNLSGLLSPLPIFATIFAISTHHFQGAKVARQILHGVLISSFACSVFFLVVASLLEKWGIAATFSCAVFAALLTQGSVLWLLRRLNNRHAATTKAASLKSVS